MEYDLLKVFTEFPNRTLSRDRLFNLDYDKDRDPFDRSVYLRVSRLRRKIESEPGKPQIIKTVYGVGNVVYQHNAGDAH